MKKKKKREKPAKSYYRHTLTVSVCSSQVCNQRIIVVKAWRTLRLLLNGPRCHQVVNPKRDTFQRGFERHGSVLSIANHNVRQLTGKMSRIIRDGASEYQLLASTALNQTAQDCANELVRELVVFS